jgi:osmotically-inducible protein OsmY
MLFMEERAGGEEAKKPIYSSRNDMEKLKPIIAFLILLTAALLSSCTPVSIASTGAQAVYDHHNIQKKLNDQYITLQAYRKIYNETDRYKDTNISVATLNSEVLLTGEALSPQYKNEVERIVKKIPGVHEVYNHLALSAPSSTLTSMSDTWITTKIKSKLIAAEDDLSQIKVITENGTVYLMGVVQPHEADSAVTLAKNTEGVQEVVKIFYYVRISKEYKV